MAAENSAKGSSEYDSSTSLTLLHRAAAQDAESWQQLDKLYRPLVRYWARQAGVPSFDVEDVVQEVFQVLSVKLSEFDPNRGRGFRAWLWGICRYKLKEYLRRIRFGTTVATGGTDACMAMATIPEDPDEDTWTSIGASGAEQLLHTALNLIRQDTQPHVWEAFWKMAIDGRTAAEVSQESGMSVRAVRQAKYRVLQRLRLELGTDADALLAD